MKIAGDEIFTKFHCLSTGATQQLLYPRYLIVLCLIEDDHQEDRNYEVTHNVLRHHRIRSGVGAALTDINGNIAINFYTWGRKMLQRFTVGFNILVRKTIVSPSAPLLCQSGGKPVFRSTEVVMYEVWFVLNQISPVYSWSLLVIFSFILFHLFIIFLGDDICATFPEYWVSDIMSCRMS